MKKILFVVFLTVLYCKPKEVDYTKVSLYSKSNNLQAIVEIPAGTNHKIEYNKSTLTFEVDQRNGKDRIIDFLPYLGNYGFIPSTFSDSKEGGDGDALDVLIISENLATGTVVEIIPIGMLKLIDANELDYKIIAIPAKANMQILTATNFNDFSTNYPKVKTIIEHWFTNYDNDDATFFEGWGNENDAIAEIEKWRVNN